MNLGQLISEIKRYGFGTGTGHTDATITELINTSLSEVLSAAAWPFAEQDEAITVSPSSGTLPAPSSLSKVRSIYLAPYSTGTNLDTGPRRKLVQLPPQDFLELEAGSSTDGPPRYYSVFSSGTLTSGSQAQVIRIFPKANGNYRGSMFYLRHAPTLSTSTDTPFLPTRYHYVLVDSTLARLYASTDQMDQAKAAEERTALRIEQMKADLLETTLDRRDALTSGYSVGSIIKEVRDHGFDRAGDSLIRLWINDVINELAGADNWPWLETGPVEIETVSGEALLQLPSDCAKPMKIQFPGSNINLFRERHDLLLDKYATDVEKETGQPERYAMWGTSAEGVPSIRLFPVPNGSYSLRLWYQRVPQPLNTIDDLPPFPARHHRLLVLGVLVRATQMMGDEQSLAKLPLFKEEFDERLEKMRNDLLRPQLDNNDYVPMDGDPESSF